MTTIGYQGYVSAFRGYAGFISDLIERHQLVRLCEVGGGASPMLQVDEIERRGLELTIVDCSEDELDKAPPAYQRVVADIADPDFSPPGRFDLVFSKMLAEHVVDAEQFHRNTRALLRDDGFAVHFFPTLTTLPFFVNRYIPEAAGRRIMGMIGRPTSIDEGKFPAYYRWCRGPTRRQLARLESVGFDVVEYRGVFGHDYYKPIGPLHRLEARKEAYLLEHPVPTLASYAVVVLRRR